MERLFLALSGLLFTVFMGVFFLLRCFSLERQIQYWLRNTYYRFLTTFGNPI
ncbi:hypothetical protein HNR53_004729 [Bacillus benzoevorans]|uniref:Uncharacterized protein n=1 Tax=Bacillus benzoevorans TaxID=1456 RepID=A0A7X0LXP8_9BACI|nr:hypothetical protein [Bacillus benzoevorans]